MVDLSPPPEAAELWQAGAPLPKRKAARRRGAARTLALVGYLALSVACMGLATLTFVFIAAPAELLRDELVEQVKLRTGRDLLVAGPTSLTVFPVFGVRIEDVTLAAPPGMEGAPMLALKSVEAALDPFSLFARRMAVKRLVLNRPVLDLRIDAQGRRSWEFASSRIRLAQLAAPAPASDAPQSFAPTRQENAGLPRLQDALDALANAATLRIIDGTLRYSDAQSSTREEIAGIDLELTGGQAPAARGRFLWHDAALAVEATLALAPAAGEGSQRRFELSLRGAPFEAAFEGLSPSDADAALTGTVRLKARSARALWRWVGGEHAAIEEGPPLELAGQLSAQAGRLALGAFRGTIGEAPVSGDLEVEFRQGLPHVAGQVKVSELDVGELVHARSEPTREPAGAVAGRDLGSLAATPGREAGSPRPATVGWSEEPIDLSLLARLDADVSLSVEHLVYERIKTQQGRLGLAVHARVAKVTLEDVQLYDGRVRGEMVFDGSGQIPATATTATLEGVSTLPLLKDALGIGWLEGRSTINVTLAGEGGSERQIVEGLSGKIELATANGAITGLDAAKLLHALGQARVPALDKGERTPFSECAATFKIVHGEAENQDLRVVSSAVSVTGSGTIHLPKRELDYTLRARVTASPPREGTVVSLAGLELPVRLHGRWEAPAIDPMLKGAVKDQDKAAAAIKQIGKNLQSPEVQDAVRGLIGGDGTARVKPRELLDKLLKRE
jgi:AsmA protein